MLAAGAGAAALAACRDGPRELEGGWVDALHERGHRVRDAAPLPPPSVQHRTDVLVLGGGVAGLAALRASVRQGAADAQLLELSDHIGGNSRGHQLGGMACPLGAHYLPLPTPDAREVSEWLFEIGLLRQQSGRTVADERHLCHSPQERLFFQGAWVDGLLPPATPGSTTLAQYQRFAREVDALQGFALPAHRSRAISEHAALDRQTFAAWLGSQGFDDAQLRWYLDYCCRDDYGAGLERVSAWAGVHYFASRHGFHPPGVASEVEHDPVFTWPDGNAWLMQRLAAPLRERLHTGIAVRRISEQRDGVSVEVWNERERRSERWTAQRVIVALPLFIGARLIESPPKALRTAVAGMHYAPWLVANLQLDGPLVDRPGAAPAWDNVVHGSRGLGYVDAMHQSLRPVAGPTVLTAYQALPESERGALLQQPWQHWAEQVLADLALAHPDLRRRLQRIELMRWGHAMAIPTAGTTTSSALAALRRQRGRLRFAHSDLAGYSVFEEAFTAGCEAAMG